jgi:hypothetical protein
MGRKSTLMILASISPVSLWMRGLGHFFEISLVAAGMELTRFR